MKKGTLALCLLLVVTLMCPAALATSVVDATQDVVTATEALPMPALPLTDTQVTFTVMFPRDTLHGDFENMWFLQAVETLTNVKLKIQPVESSGWTEKLNLSFASNDLPDLFLNGITYSQAGMYGTAGLLQPLEELLKAYSPNSQRIFEYLPSTVKNLTATDGHIYLMPAFNTTARDMVQIQSFLNMDWVSKAGYEKPTNLDELYDVLIALKTSDGNGNGQNDEIPLSYIYKGTGSGAFTAVLTAFGFVDPQHDIIDDQYVYVPIHENFRAYLTYLAKLYAEGLLDPEIFTQTAEQYSAKISSYILGMESGQVKDYLSVPEQKHAYEMVGPLVSEYNQAKIWPAASNEGGTSFCITVNCAEPEIAVKLLDFLYSEEGSFMTKCGPEKGQWDGEGGWTRGTEADGSYSYTIEYDKEKYAGFWAFRMANGLMSIPFFYTDAHAKLVLGADVDGKLISEQVFSSGAFDARRFGYPNGVTFTEDEQDTLAVYTLLDSYVDQMVAQFVTGSIDITDDAQWNAYLQNIEMMDVQTLIDTRQAAYDRWNQN